jgi:hypothetical protein
VTARFVPCKDVEATIGSGLSLLQRFIQENYTSKGQDAPWILASAEAQIHYGWASLPRKGRVNGG